MKKKILLSISATLLCSIIAFAQNINFADSKVKEICVANWDTNSDGELSYEEAAAVTSIKRVFQDSQITSFDEFQYFTGVTSINIYAFKNCYSLTSVIIPNNVTTIGPSAFFNSGLTSVIIPNSVTVIGNLAFYCCQELTSITIPNSVTSIGSMAFSECTNLASVIIGNSVTRILSEAFANCKSLISINIPNSLTSIEDDTFSNCTSLTSITIPNSVTSIGNGAFYNCESLTDINIPISVTSIGSYAFCDCSSLTSITIPNNVTSISYSPFKGCNNLIDVFVHITTPLKLIDETFSNRANATLHVPKGCISKYQAADYWKEFKNIVEIIPNIDFADAKVKELCVTNWDTDGDGELSIEEAATVEDIGNVFINQKEITSFDEFQYFTGISELVTWGDSYDAWGGFVGCSNLKSIIIPNSVTEITGANADWDYFSYYNRPEVGLFYGCKSLSTVIIPNSVAGIGAYTFMGCEALTTINLPETLVELGTGAFKGCTSLESVYLPNTVTSIGEGAFDGCKALVSVNIPNNITNIGVCTFRGCSSLTSISLPSTVKKIGQSAFAFCTKLTSINLPNSVESIGNIWDRDWSSIADHDYEIISTSNRPGTFENCTNLTSINFPNQLTSIGDCCFKGCTSLQNLTLPNEIKEIGLLTFAGCTGLTSINIPNQLSVLKQGIFKDCVGLTNITIPNSVKSMESVYYANDWNIESHSGIEGIAGPFEGCTGLKNIEIPNSLKTIGISAFRGCTGLESIIIPNSVTNIEDFAFYDCKSLTSIELPNTINLINRGTFAGSGLKSISFPSSIKIIYCETDIYTDVEPWNSLYNLLPEKWGTFEGCTALQKIDFNNVELIGPFSFYGCEALTAFDIPNTVKSIYVGAFQNCTNLSSVTIPKSVTDIDYRNEYIGDKYIQILHRYDVGLDECGTFFNCPNLTKVTVDITEPREIIEETFSNRANATLHVPKGCISKYQAADYWKEFKNIVEISPFIEFADAKVKELCVTNWDTDGDGELSEAEAAAVTSLGTVFKKSQITSFDELQYFTGLTNIGKDAFNASTLTSVILPENVTALEENAFLDCKSLVSIILPAKVQTIGLNALSGCTAMVDITVDEQNESLCSVDGVLFNKDKTILIQYPAAKGTAYTVPDGTTTIARDAFYMSGLESILLPSTLTELVYDAFGYCRKLTELTIPEGVTTIGEYILDHCTALTTLTIPSTVTTIGQRMANYCTAITDVYTYIEEPFDINANCFHTKAYTNATLHVPYGTGSAYANATGWKEFGKVMNMEDTSPAYAVLSADRKTLTFYNDGDKEGKGGTAFSISNGDNTPEWYAQRTTVTKVVFDESFATARPKSTHSWFEGMTKLTALEGMENLSTTNTINMSRMFFGCSSLKRVDLDNLDISYATDISGMFSGCVAMASLDLSAFDLQEGTTTDNLLLNCKGLKTLKLSASMSGIAAGACQGVGTSSKPCILFVPSDFNFGVSTTGTFQWKSGYFRTADEPVVYAKDTDFYSGQTKNVAICLDNGEEQYNSYQFDLTLPEGFTFETNASGKIVYNLSSRYTGSVNVSTTMLDGNTCRVTAYMASTEYITGTDGAIISIGIKADESLSLGSWEATLSNIFVGMPNDVSVKCVDTSFNLVIGSEMLGDVNHDGFVNISDVTYVISYILNKAPSPFYMNEADVNQDGWINISDVTAIINIILNKATVNAPANARQSTLDHVFLQQTANGYDICLENTTSYTACEMTLRLPEGCMLRAARMDNDRAEGHYVLTRNLGEGMYRLVVYSENNNALIDGEPPMLHLTINGTLGDNARLSNILFVDDQHACVAFPDVESIITGINGVDADSDTTPTYNLQGMPTQKNNRGVHVKRGGKYVIK